MLISEYFCNNLKVSIVIFQADNHREFQEWISQIQIVLSEDYHVNPREQETYEEIRENKQLSQEEIDKSTIQILVKDDRVNNLTSNLGKKLDS